MLFISGLQAGILKRISPISVRASTTEAVLITGKSSCKIRFVLRLLLFFISSSILGIIVL